MATAITPETRRRFSLPEWRGGPSAKGVAFGAAVILAELILAAALASGRLSIALMVFVAAAALAFAFAYPLATAVLTLALGVSIFHGQWFAFTLGPLDANAAELLLFSLFIVALIRPRHRTWGGVAGAGLAVFLGLLGISTALAVSAGDVELLGSLAWGRVFAFYAFFYIVVRLFGDRDSITRLLGWAAALAALTGFTALFISVASGPASFLQDPAQQFIRDEEGLGLIQRVRLPGLALAYGLFWYAVVRTTQTHGTWRLLWGAALAGMFVNIAVSFNRNMWVGLSLGLLAMVLLSGPQVRRRLIAAIAAVGIAIALVATQGGSDSRFAPLVERGLRSAIPKACRPRARCRPARSRPRLPGASPATTRSSGSGRVSTSASPSSRRRQAGCGSASPSCSSTTSTCT